MINMFTVSIMQTGPRKLEMKPLSIFIQHLFGGKYSQKIYQIISKQTWMKMLSKESLQLNSHFTAIAFRIHHSRHGHHNQSNHISNHTQEFSAKHLLINGADLW